MSTDDFTYYSGARWSSNSANVYIETTNETLIEAYEEAYVDALCKEISIRTNEWPQLQSMTVDTIYFGGGTPTHLKISFGLVSQSRSHYRMKF